VLLPIAIRRGGLRDLIGKWRPLVIFAAIEFGIPWLALSTAEQHMTSSLAGVVVGYALGPAILARYLTKVPAVTVNGLALAICCIAYAPIAALHWPAAVPSLPVIGSIAVLSIVCTALAFLLFFALIAEIGPVRATVITYVNPAVAALLGVAVLRESFTVGMAAGFVLVLAGSVLSTRRRNVAAPGLKTPEAQAGEAV